MDFIPHAKPVIALDVLRAIDAAIAKDDGATFRMNLRKWISLAEDAYRGKEDSHRTHLGASEIGERCERKLWYGFRWAYARTQIPRMVRLLNRGHLEEARFAALLETMGLAVATQDKLGKQFKLSLLDGNYGGSCDCLLAWPNSQTLIIGEFKTHNRDSFEELAGPLKEWRAYVNGPDNPAFTGKGVRLSKPKHYAQAQVYRAGFQAQATLYIAVCKDTDDLYAEWITDDGQAVGAATGKATRVIAAAMPPPKINASPGWHECRFCDARGICHNGAEPERNCRTCKHGWPYKDGIWLCMLREGMRLAKQQQLIGCPQHAFIEGLR